MQPHAQSLLDMLAQLFDKSIQIENAYLQEECLTLLSCIAGVLDNQFGNYYEKFMPGLKQLLQSVKMETNKQKELRSHVIQAIGFIMEAVKDQPEKCKADAQMIMNDFVVFLSQEGLKEDDPQITSVQNSITQLAAVLKEDFKPFIKPILERLFIDAARDIDIKVEEADDNEKSNEHNEKTGQTELVFKMQGFEG